MSILNILATVEPPVPAPGAAAVHNDVDIVPVNFIWEQISSLTWLQAVVAISFGVVYLLYGWRIFKILVVISFGLMGMFGGIYAGRYAGSEMWGGIIGMALLAFLAVPLMKYAVCALGAVAGGILSAGIWYAFDLPQTYMWAGAVIGIVAGGMIGFIVLRVAVMLFTSLSGSIILVVGVLALLHIYENGSLPQTTHIYDMVNIHNWFLPVAVLVPTIAGIIVQNSFIKKSPKWEL